MMKTAAAKVCCWLWCSIAFLAWMSLKAQGEPEKNRFGSYDCPPGWTLLPYVKQFEDHGYALISFRCYQREKACPKCGPEGYYYFRTTLQRRKKTIHNKDVCMNTYVCAKSGQSDYRLEACPGVRWKSKHCYEEEGDYHECCVLEFVILGKETCGPMRDYSPGAFLGYDSKNGDCEIEACPSDWEWLVMGKTTEVKGLLEAPVKCFPINPCLMGYVYNKPQRTCCNKQIKGDCIESCEGIITTTGTGKSAEHKCCVKRKWLSGREKIDCRILLRR